VLAVAELGIEWEALPSASPRILVVATDRLLVYNVFRTRCVRLHDIDRVEDEYEGLRLRLKNGKRVTVTAIQKWNVSRWRGRPTRADHVAELIMDRVREAE